MDIFFHRMNNLYFAKNIDRDLEINHMRDVFFCIIYDININFSMLIFRFGILKNLSKLFFEIFKQRR